MPALSFLIGATLGATAVITWQHTWRALLGWALSRGDTRLQ